MLVVKNYKQFQISRQISEVDVDHEKSRNCVELKIFNFPAEFHITPSWQIIDKLQFPAKSQKLIYYEKSRKYKIIQISRQFSNLESNAFNRSHAKSSLKLSICTRKIWNLHDFFPRFRSRSSGNHNFIRDHSGRDNSTKPWTVKGARNSSIFKRYY